MVILAWIQAQKSHTFGQKITIFSNYRAPSVTGRPSLSYLIHKHSIQAKKLGILMCFCNNNNLKSQNLKIAISAQKSKTVRQILDILSIFIQIYGRNCQELGGSGGNGFFLTALKITFWLIWAWKILRFQKFLFLWITYGLYHNGPQ